VCAEPKKLRKIYNNTIKSLQNCTTLGDNKSNKNKTNLHRIEKVLGATTRRGLIRNRINKRINLCRTQKLKVMRTTTKSIFGEGKSSRSQ
jgi:hypothetical protein